MNQVESQVAPADGLSQLERLTCAFTAPSRTFDDIRSGHRSWWLPFIVLSIAGYILFGVVSKRIGIEQTIQNQIRMNPRAQEQMSRATPEQIEKAQNYWGKFTQVMFIAGPVVGLLYALSISTVFLATINFGFEGHAKFADLIAVTYYAWLPTAIQTIMGIIVMWFQPPELFNVKNFAPTNPAALLLDPATTNDALYTFLSQIDFVTIWTLVLFSIGVSTVAGVRRRAGYISVFGWWTIVVIIKVGMAAVFS